MRDTQSLAATHAALHFVVGSSMPAEHKAVIIEVLTQALRAGEAALALQQAAEPAVKSWLPHETAHLQTSLQGRVANSWQHADEMLMRLAAQLHRRANDVRAKATELGLGAGVDYRVAREQRARQQSE
jgi:hypothetical protein